MSEERSQSPEPWRVKYDGRCSRCGTPLPRGTVAVWERATRTIRCVECPVVAPPAAPDPIDLGVGGASSRREHDRLVAKRDAAITANHSPLVGRLVRALTTEPQSTRAWEVGARGEEKLAAAILAMPSVSVLNDRRIPGSTANIDHIVIAPAGIFVVDAKLHKGLIRIRDRGSFLRSDRRLYVGTRDRSELAWKVARQAEVVMAALDAAAVEPLPPITPVLCFVDGSWPILRPPREFEGVRLESERSIKQLVLRSNDLDQARMQELLRILAAALPSK